jgi:hypothetical protein
MKDRAAVSPRKRKRWFTITKVLVVLSLSVMVYSCATMAQAKPEDYSRTYTNVSSEELFDTARTVLFELNAQIENADRDNGYIQAVLSHTSVATTVLTGTATIHIRYTVNILGDQIRVRIANVSGRQEYDADKATYSKWWSTFEEKL